MLDMKKIWQNIKDHPIAGKVVAGLILLALTKLFDTIFSLNIFSSIIGFTSQRYIVPIWGLVLIGIIPGAYIFYHHPKFIFLEEYGVYKMKNSESCFCIICKSPLQKIDDHWFCNKCSRSFGKRTLVKPSGRKVISQGVVKSNWMSGVSRW